jgi:hypothetical protein
VYRKQFKITEVHQLFIKPSLDELLKLGVVKRANLLYNSPIFCGPKKQSQSQSYSFIYKCSTKEISESIGVIGSANSTIFSTLDLTSGFWQRNWTPTHNNLWPLPFRERVNTIG